MKTIIALALSTLTCGCATNVEFNNGSAQDMRIAQITAEEGARIERSNAEHLRIVRETEQKIQRQILQAKSVNADEYPFGIKRGCTPESGR